MRCNREIDRKFNKHPSVNIASNPIASSSRTALFCCCLMETGFDSPGYDWALRPRSPVKDTVHEGYWAKPRVRSHSSGGYAIQQSVRRSRKSTVNPHRCCLCFGASVRAPGNQGLSSQHVENDHPCSLSLKRLRDPSFDPERTHIDLACRNIWSTRSDQLRRVAEVSLFQWRRTVTKGEPHSNANRSEIHRRKTHRTTKERRGA
jgi:hypothetical protein